MFHCSLSKVWMLIPLRFDLKPGKNLDEFCTAYGGIDLVEEDTETHLG